MLATSPTQLGFTRVGYLKLLKSDKSDFNGRGEGRLELAMVILNRIYTRTGDDGTTALGSGERRPKYDLRVSAYGTVDETNAAIGVVRLHLKDARELDTMLGLIQNDLFHLVAALALPHPLRQPQRLR